jgi:uncharacterized protein (TIGR03437 family)
MRRFFSLIFLIALASSSAAAYYHFIRYPSRSGPYTPIYQKFDLTALVNKTVYFYITDQQPSLAPGDSYEALIGQVRQALAVWNNVPTSDLRVAYGGIANIASLQAQTPWGEITFDELPPGVLGLAGPMTTQAPANGFIPIVRSRIILPRNLSNPSRTTASESFFNSLVHEIGHALGLQHTLTGSAMTMEVTRSTTRARPLGADDAAGLSWLYPAANFAASTGAITGRVTSPGGQPLNLISVVAINPGGAVVSAFTAPDGTYQINGLPAGTYLVYAHSLPPSSQPGLGQDNIVLPVDDTGASFNASGPVETQFFGGAKDPNFSTPVVVSAGNTNSGINFQLADRPAQIYDVTTYSFPGNGAPAIFPAYLNTSLGAGTVIAYGQGLAANVSNVSVGVIGGGVNVQPGSPFPYAPDPRYTEIDLGFTPVTGIGPVHFFFRLNGDVYVRPGAVQLVTRPAPLVRDVQVETDANGNVILNLGGDNLAADSQVYLDGVPAAVRSFDPATGRLRAAPPSGVPGRQSVISVYNADGQSSVFVQPASPATYTYPAAGTPGLILTPASAPAGQDVTIDIQGTNTNFADGQTVVGFGTPDVVARRVWVLSPTHLLVVASISPRAVPASGTVSVTSGLQVVTIPGGFRVDPAVTSSTVPSFSFGGLVNSATSQPRVAPGSLATLYGINLSLGPTISGTIPLPTTLGGTTVTINNQAAPLLLVSPAQINFQVPYNLPAGPAILRVNNGVAVSQPMAVQIDAVAPGIFRITNAVGAPVDANNAARLGDTLVIYATGLGPVIPPVTAGTAAPPANAALPVRVNIAGVDLTPSYAGLTPGTAGVYQVNIPLPLNLAATPAAPLYITAAGQASNIVTIALRLP